MRFVGRSEQLNELADWHRRVLRDRRGFMVAARGRRQVGKSTLYTEFIKREQVPHVFFTAIKDGSRSAQLEALQRHVREAARAIPDGDVLFASAPASWSDAFGRLRVAAQQSPIVVVLDEFPWAAQADPSLEGELQSAWDRDLQHLPVLLILVGSDVTMMERATHHDRALYGRAREDVIHAFNPAEVAAALGGASPAIATFDAYLATGGYPKLVDDFNRAGGLRGYVANGLSDENSDLIVVAQRSLDAEFPPDAQARRVLSAIGGHEVGHPTFSSVVGRLPEESSAAGTALSRALKLLVDDKRVVAIETPAGQPAGTRVRRYRITDPYLRFWFRFVEPHVANVARGRSDLAVRAFEHGWSTWRGVAIEPEVQAAVVRLAPRVSALEGVTDVAGWWNRDHSVQVDLVAMRGSAAAAIGSIKWRPRRQFSADERAALAGARAAVPGAAGAGLVAVCPAGIRKGVDVDVALDAADLLAAWSS